MDPNTVFVIAITTARMIMPGMPAMDNMPGGMNVPGMNTPMRTLTMDLTSNKTANAESKAECEVPDGLKVGPKVILDIDLPQKGETSDEKSGDKESGKMPDFKIKSYWGCAEVVPDGQPKIIDSKHMTADMQRAMSEKNSMMSKQFKQASASNDGSHAYWPGHDAKELAKNSTCPGIYNLTTNYCGGTSILFDKPQDFLAPIDLVSPGKNADLAKTIKVDWKSVPNAVGYILTAFGGDEKLMVTWTSSFEPNPPADLASRALTKEQVNKLLENGVLIPADKTSCRIPAGIFKEVGNVMVTVTAIGEDKVQTRDGIETNVVVRSNATVMLGEGMMGMGSDEDTEDINVKKPDTSTQDEEDQPAVNDDESSNDNGDVIDQADEATDKVDEKADKVDNIVNKAKKWFKR